VFVKHPGIVGDPAWGGFDNYHEAKTKYNEKAYKRILSAYT
jgi:hypothetical protein